MDSSSDEEYFDCESEPIKYYGVVCPKDNGKGFVTIDMNEVRKKTKIFKGSRFKSFYDPLEAKKYVDNFMETPVIEDSVNVNKKKLNGPKKDLYGNVSMKDLLIMKTVIEGGNLLQLKEIVKINPRHLVSESDSPTLLHMRFRHNALHVAASFNQANIAHFILESISKPQFWQTMYPNADDKCNQGRMNRVLDMYLNAPEIGNMETPLHLAAKFGNKDCLRALLGQELTDTSLRNKGGLRADEIVCQRYNGDERDVRIAEILEIFSEKFVVLMDGDKRGARVLEKSLSHWQLLRLLRDRNDEYRLNDSPITSSNYNSRNNNNNISIDDLVGEGFVRAFIGPIQMAKADQLCYRWAVLNAEDAPKFEELRKSDAEKGMECHGRYLATIFNVQWRELWHFLPDKYVDLCSDEGLAQFDEYLCQLESARALEYDNSNVISSGFHNSSIVVDDDNSSCIDDNSVVTTTNNINTTTCTSSSSNSSTTSFIYNSLIRLFNKMTITNPILTSSTINNDPINASANIFACPIKDPIKLPELPPKITSFYSNPPQTPPRSSLHNNPQQTPPRSCLHNNPSQTLTSTPSDYNRPKNPPCRNISKFPPLASPFAQSTPYKTSSINTSNTNNSKISLRMSRTPFNISVVGSGFLTPTDRQVRHAILSSHINKKSTSKNNHITNVSNGSRHLKYPRVTNWLHNLSQIDPDNEENIEDLILEGDDSSQCSLFAISHAHNNNNSPTSLQAAPQPSKSITYKKTLERSPITSIVLSRQAFKKPQMPKCLSPLSQIELSD